MTYTYDIRRTYGLIAFICISKDFKLTHAAGGISFSRNGKKFNKNPMQKFMNKLCVKGVNILV